MSDVKIKELIGDIDQHLTNEKLYGEEHIT